VTLWSDPLQTNPALNSTIDIAGQYVWHCHIVEHEDNAMMVPCVGDKASAPGCSVVP
jgi:FtsP/CotA-like multicopper oxidase with cupredoxin domain